MLCDSCREAGSDAHRGGTERDHAGAWVATLFCRRCGRLMPLADPDGVLLDGLSRLARFGIGAGSAPLLASSESDV